MCTGTPATFTVANAPASYTWSSSAKLALVSTSGNTASFLANADGSAWVGIQVAGVEVARRNVTVGMQAGGISGPYDLSCGCLVQIDHPGEYRFYATNVPSNLTLMQVRWELTPPNDSFLALFSGKSPMIGFGGGGIYTLKMKWEGECGFSPYAVRNILVWGPSNNDDGRGIVLSAYPNPASSVIYIKLEEESQATLQSRQSSLSPADVYRVQLVAVQTRAVALNQTISNYSGYLELNVSSIPEGLYSLVLIRNDTILHTETILIQL
jgi:hypothetical protein